MESEKYVCILKPFIGAEKNVHTPNTEPLLNHYITCNRSSMSACALAI